MDPARLAEIKALHWDNSVASAVARELMVAVETAWRERDEAKQGWNDLLKEHGHAALTPEGLNQLEVALIRAARAEASLRQLREAAEAYMQAKGRNCAADFSDMEKQDVSYRAYLKAEENLRRALSSAQDPAR